MPFKQLIYLSDLVDRNESELPRILESAVRHNKEDGITGMLLYADGNFLQVIEGEPAAVDVTYQRICADPRHRNLTNLFDEQVPEREFSRWSMGFKQLSAQDVRAFPQHAPYFKYGFSAKLLGPAPGAALDMLKLFSKGAF